MNRVEYIILLLAAITLSGSPASAETLRATSDITPTNVNWMALSRIEKAVRAGQDAEFVWPEYPAVSYAKIRRTLWIAALHGITKQTGANVRTRLLLEPELELAKTRLESPFSFDVAVRENAWAGNLIPLLVQSQIGCQLIGENENSPLDMKLTCREDGTVSAGPNVSFPSLATAVSFSLACHTDNELVFEENGDVANGVFIRRFDDGTATVVNLTDNLRRNLTYRRNLWRQTFDLHPAGVIHLLKTDPPRLTAPSHLRFITGLWQVSFELGLPTRVIDTSLLSTVVPETYMGGITYQTTVCMPYGENPLFLSVETAGSEVELTIDGKPFGIRAWEPFEWAVPVDCRGKNVKVEIRVEKQTLDGYLQGPPSWRNR